MKSSKLLKLPLAIALIIYFFYLLVSGAPAGWAAWAAHKAVPALWLNSVDGSLWHGTAKSAQVDVGAESFALGQVTWSLSPWSLLILRPCVDIEANLPTQQISGSFCHALSGKTSVKNLTIDMPVSAIKALLPMPATGALSVQVLAAKFDAQGSISNLDARASWQQAQIFNGDNWMDFGSFAAKAEHDGNGGVIAKLFDLQGPYKSDLEATWMVGQDWKVIGTVAPQQGASDLVVQGLQILGEDLGDGVYKIQWP